MTVEDHLPNPLDIARLALGEAPDSIRALAEIRDNPQVAPTARVAAANAILARALGRAGAAEAQPPSLQNWAVGRMPDEPGPEDGA